jgi:hypothetical protein
MACCKETFTWQLVDTVEVSGLLKVGRIPHPQPKVWQRVFRLVAKPILCPLVNCALGALVAITFAYDLTNEVLPTMTSSH